MRTFKDLSVGRANNFDFLRFVLASLVIFSHSWPLSGINGAHLQNSGGEILIRLTRGQIDFGTLAVSFFFVASGFLVTQSWLRSKDFWQYMAKRALRIYPGYLAATILTAFVFAPLGSSNIEHYYHAFRLRHFLLAEPTLGMVQVPPTFLRNPFPIEANGSLWTIRYEFACYLGVAALALVSAYRKRAIIGTLFLLMVIAVPLQPIWFSHIFGHFTKHEQQFVHLFPSLICSFLAGMTCYVYRDRIPYDRRIIAAAAVILIVLSRTGGLHIALPILGSYLFLATAFSPSIPFNGWGRFGDFSYGIYVYGFPIQQLFAAYMPLTHKPYLLFALAYPCTLIAAVVSWYLVEKPALQFKRRVAKPAMPSTALSDDETRTETILPSPALMD